MKSVPSFVALYAVLAGTAVNAAASFTKPKWTSVKVSKIRGGQINLEERDFKPSTALMLSSIAAGAYAVQSCFPESFNDMHTSLDDFIGSKSGKFWQRWFSIGLFQHTALTATAALSKDEKTKKAFCLISALNWAAWSAGLIFTREDQNPDRRNIDLAVDLGMSAVMLAGAGGFDWFKDKAKDVKNKAT